MHIFVAHTCISTSRQCKTFEQILDRNTINAIFKSGEVDIITSIIISKTHNISLIVFLIAILIFFSPESIEPSTTLRKTRLKFLWTKVFCCAGVILVELEGSWSKFPLILGHPWHEEFHDFDKEVSHLCCVRKF